MDEADVSLGAFVVTRGGGKSKLQNEIGEPYKGILEWSGDANTRTTSIERLKHHLAEIKTDFTPVDKLVAYRPDIFSDKIGRDLQKSLAKSRILVVFG